MKTKSEFLDFLRNSTAQDVIVPHVEMVEIFGKPVALAQDLDNWLAANDLDFDASLSVATLHWLFRRR